MGDQTRQFNAFDEKEYTFANAADVDWTSMKQVKEYYVIASAGWKTLCYEENHGQCCYLLGKYFNDISYSYFTDEYSPRKGFNVWNEACQRLNNASCCESIVGNYLLNDVNAKNWTRDTIDPLYMLEARRRACLEQTEESTGGPRPSDLKDKISAGQSCAELFDFVHTFRTQVVNPDKVPTHLKWVPRYQGMNDPALRKELQSQVNPKNPLKPDISGVLSMLRHINLGVFLEQACLFKDALSCHRLFEAKVKGKYGVAIDRPGAVPVCEEACRRNVTKACFNAWRIYQNGIYVPPDAKKASYYHALYEELSKPMVDSGESGRDLGRVADVDKQAGEKYREWKQDLNDQPPKS